MCCFSFSVAQTLTHRYLLCIPVKTTRGSLHSLLSVIWLQTPRKPTPNWTHMDPTQVRKHTQTVGHHRADMRSVCVCVWGLINTVMGFYGSTVSWVTGFIPSQGIKRGRGRWCQMWIMPPPRNDNNAHTRGFLNEREARVTYAPVDWCFMVSNVSQMWAIFKKCSLLPPAVASPWHLDLWFQTMERRKTRDGDCDEE